MRVSVESGSRLHAGFYYAGGEWRVKWGGLGFYVERPRLLVEAWACSKPLFEGLAEFESESRRALEALGVQGVCFRVVEALPAHVGLGSTTQTLLSVLTGGCAVKGLSCDPVEIARVIGRGRVSGVGTLLFKYGGFVMDAGSPDPGGPRALVRLNIPESWRFIILTPDVGRGLGEELEKTLLEEPWKPGVQPALYMSRGSLRLASGVARGDLEEALEGLREVQTGTGLYFKDLQGGVYRGALASIVDEASKDRIVLAQSSWGPTLYTIALEGEAESLARKLGLLVRELGFKASITVSKPRNRGASIVLNS